MFYRPEQAGWNKTMACRHYCSELNPDTAFEVHNMNVCAEENRAKFKDTLASACAASARTLVGAARR